MTPDILLENLASKASATMALRTLLSMDGMNAGEITYVINCGEEAVGERYQRGGGNLGKAIAEMCGCIAATGADVKAFCCGPVHALIMAGALVTAGVFRQVAVVAGCSLAKLGMKFRGHLDHDQPVLEDVLAAVAILVGEDDGSSPRLRLRYIRGTRTNWRSGMAKARELATASPSNRPDTMGTAGLPIFSISIMSWTIHEQHVPQSAVAPTTRSHSSAACFTREGVMG